MNRLREMVARSVPFSAQIARALSAASLTSGDAGCHDGGACDDAAYSPPHRGASMRACARKHLWLTNLSMHEEPAARQRGKLKQGHG